MRIPSGVAAGHPATAAAGIETLAAGGTAADAAVAATLAACAAETIFTGLGGGGFATYYDAAASEVTCLDFFCAMPGVGAPRQPGPMRPVAIKFGSVPLRYEIGGASVAVPGVPAGCGEIHRRWGRLPWAQVVAPAIMIAADGAAFPAIHAGMLPSLAEAMLRDQGRAAYQGRAGLLQGGEMLFHPGLADALSMLAQGGPQVFYEGKLGRLMVELVQADGGILSRDDLLGYRVLDLPVQRAPLAGHTVLGRADLNRTLATIAALPAGFALRRAPDRAVALAQVLGPGQRDGLGDTTNVTAVDAFGNACVITTTLGLGAGLWLPGLGVHLNSMLGEDELNTGDLAQGQRLASMMCPLVALGDDGTLRLAAGSAGASRIRSALLMTLTSALIEGLPTADAVRAPRLHTVDNTVHIEPGAADPSVLAQAGFEVTEWDDVSHYFGGVSAAGVSGTAGDPRRGGCGRTL